jgi:predicted transcriptional regulator
VVKVEPVSSDFLKAAEAERDLLAKRLLEAQETVEHFETLVKEAIEQVASLADRIRAIEEVAGLAPQMAICNISEELRGERLREVAVDVLRRLAASGDPIHYRAWFEELVESGFRVRGRDPLATFLTQVRRIDQVESVGRRSGLYRLRAAA